MKKIVLIIFLLLILPSVLAVDFDEGPTDEEMNKFDDILSPVMKVYNFVKYAATVIGVLVLVFSGISFITAGGEVAKREKAKHMAVGVVVGLIVIWVAPMVVDLIFN